MEKCRYNENRDIKRVVSGLAVEIDDVLKTGIVKDTTAELDYNNLDNPANVLGRVESVFDALEAKKAIRKAGKNVAQQVEKNITTPSASGGSGQ